MENLYKNSARLYDMDNRDIVGDDIPFYVEYAKQQGGEVLELGCGTGRVAIALAKEGLNVTGLDLSHDMLDIFREKLAKQPEIADKITITHGNMANFSLGRKFDMIIVPFRVFQLLTDDDDVATALTCIRDHLTDDGIFIVNVFDPIVPMDEENWCRPETVQWERYDDATGSHIVKKVVQDKIDTVNQVIYPQFIFEITNSDGKTQRIVDDFKLKYYFYHQLREVIEAADLEIYEEFSWYDKTPIPGRELIFVCKKKQ
ncbi:MAG: class I SAM-dependent methyltransferase [Defluviitaleaceae bacterium]|nr:class I SAM-dependent methyltransferase [Defluviitaleaceae bacterium]